MEPVFSCYSCIWLPGAIIIRKPVHSICVTKYIIWLPIAVFLDLTLAIKSTKTNSAFDHLDMKKNLFIAFEGIDGCGKSTQVKLLSENLKSAGHKVYATFEPTDSPIGSVIRNIFNHKLKPITGPLRGCSLLTGWIIC